MHGLHEQRSVKERGRKNKLLRHRLSIIVEIAKKMEG